MPEGRMLKKAISSSRINELSPLAVILFTWAISYEDEQGFIEVEPRWLKANVVPLYEDIRLEDIDSLVLEILRVEAWEPYISPTGTKLAKDPKFHKHQTIQRDADGFPRREKTSIYRDARAITLGEAEKWFKNGAAPPEIHEDSMSSTGALRQGRAPLKKGNVRESNVKEKSPLSVKDFLDNCGEDTKEIVNRLSEGKWPDVIKWLSMAIKEVQGLRADDLKKTLEIIDAKDKFTGEIWAFAIRVLKNVVKEGVTKRAEDRAREYKEQEARGVESLGDILSKAIKGGQEGEAENEL